MYEQCCKHCGIVFKSIEARDFCSGVCMEFYDQDSPVVKAVEEYLTTNPRFVQDFILLRDDGVDIIICENGWARIEYRAANARYEECIHAINYVENESDGA